MSFRHDDSSKLFVVGMSVSSTEDEVQRAFAKYDPKKVTIIK